MEPRDSGDAGNGPGRPLGRGLEDVSHLFLTSRPDAPAPPDPASPGPPGRRPDPLLLRPAQVSRDLVAALLPLDWSRGLEEGLRTIETGLPCPPCGEIDVLAADRAGRLVIIDFDTTTSDGLLLRGLAHVDWIASGTPAVQRMCPGRLRHLAAAPADPPRPQFSPLLRRVMRQLTRPQIMWVRYHAVETPAGPGILFEPVRDS